MTKFGGILYSRPKLNTPDEYYSFTDYDITYIYTHKNAISTDDYTTIYFGEAYINGKKIDDVVIKQVNSNNLTEYGQLSNELSVSRRITGTSATKYVPKVYTFIPPRTSKDRYYTLVFERVGPSLERILLNGKLPIKTCFSILYQGVEALEALHSAGFVHSDIKTGNICIGLHDPQNLKLIDMGISITYGDSPDVLRLEDRDNGSPYYVSPNIWHGKNLEPISRRHDLQSLLYVFLELYHGKLPWRSVVLDNVPLSSIAARKKQIADQKEIFIISLIDDIL
jgi:serine/threonine protein kinase